MSIRGTVAKIRAKSFIRRHFQIPCTSLSVLFSEHWRLFCVDWRYDCQDMSKIFYFPALKFGLRHSSL